MTLDLFGAPKDLVGALVGTVASINVSRGGVPKKRVTDAQVAADRLIGDAQSDLRYHGGPDRAVCLYSLDRIRALRAEGHPIDIGTAGENVTVEGLDWNLVVPGVRVQIGPTVVLEVTSFTRPCKKIRDSFIEGTFTRISDKLHPGWSRVYARVISPGMISQNDVVRVLSTGE